MNVTSCALAQMYGFNKYNVEIVSINAINLFFTNLLLTKYIEIPKIEAKTMVATYTPVIPPMLYTRYVKTS